MLQATTVAVTGSTSGTTVTATQPGSTPKLVTASPTSAPANIRLSGMNLAHIGGKPVLLASKPQSLQAQVVMQIYLLKYFSVVLFSSNFVNIQKGTYIMNIVYVLT